MKSQYYRVSSYNNARTYPMPPDVLNTQVKSGIGLFDEYLFYCTGDNEFNLYVNKPIGQDYRVEYTYSNGYYHSVKYTDFDGDFSAVPLTASIYSYSNMGYGSNLLDNNLLFNNWCLGGITVVLFLMIIFKGVLFKCLNRK